MSIEAIGFLIFITGIVFLILSGWIKIDLVRYIAVALLFVGALTINYKKIVRG